MIEHAAGTSFDLFSIRPIASRTDKSLPSHYFNRIDALTAGIERPPDENSMDVQKSP
jgi:hypothetical protein